MQIFVAKNGVKTRFLTGGETFLLFHSLMDLATQFLRVSESLLCVCLSRCACQSSSTLMTFPCDSVEGRRPKHRSHADTT